MGALLVSVLLLIAILVFVYFLQRDTPHVQLHTPAKSDTPQQAISAPPATNDLSMLPKQFIVLDLETTGLNPERHEIIEIGAIRCNLGSDTHATFQTLVKPKKKVPRRITKLTGISQEMVDDEGLQLVDVLTEFVEFIQDLPLVTFNADFDMEFLQNAAKRNGLVITNPYTCALRLARRAWPGLPSYRLTDLAKMGKLPDDDTHRALGDCRRTVPLFTAAASELGRKIEWTTPGKAYQPPA